MKFAVLDLETTGHGADDDIIQVGLVLLDEELEVTETYVSFVRPRIPIPPFITQLTGITDEDVADARELDEVLMEMIPRLDDAILVAHNVGFDAGFLNNSLDRCGYMPFVGRRLDTLDLLRILYPGLTTYQLGAVSEAFGIEHERHHQADSDAMATAVIFRSCVEKLYDLPLLTLQRLASFFQTEDDLGWFIQQALIRKESEIAVDQDAFAYFRQFALKVGDWTEELPPRYDDEESLEQIRGMDFDAYLSQVKEAFAEHVPGYEQREAQEQMFHEVYNALSGDKHLMIEAGTGTGKSLGYLIPSLFYGVQQEEKIVVSTHTINLQEQLRERDVPLLQRVLPFPFKAAVFKGRSNYMCLRKFEGKINMQDFISPSEDRITAAQMIVWLGETEHGDQEELNFSNRGGDFWDTVSSDADSCLNRSCPWFKRCFYHRAKNEANLADVVITNHSMLFTDIRADHRLLPTYGHLIIDEAHHLEDVAGKHLGLQLSYFGLLNPLQRICKDSRTGMLLQLKYKLAAEGDERVQEWTEKIDAAVPVFGEIRENWDQLFDMLFGFAAATRDNNIENGQTVLRLKPDGLPEEWHFAQTAESNVYAGLNEIVRSVDKLVSDIKEHVDDPGIQSLITDMNGSLKDLARIRDGVHNFMRLEEKGTVYWLEANTNFRAKSVQLHAVPADVSSQLKQYLFEPKQSVIMTSATLSVQKSFQYVCEQFGLDSYADQGRLVTVQLPSPFNYREQALVCIPRNFPSLKGASGDPQFVGALVASLAAAARETNGRMLVLFTSYRMLKQAYEPLKDALAGSGIQVLGQGVDSGSRSKLTRRFQQQSASILLGTSSFWEGVDIPGEALSCLAIVRLPFQPPNHPLVEAKSEILQQEKQNPFMKLSIPQAVIRFKQGFGRLVRTAQDKGIVLIFDTRVIETYYGKYFLYSLPGPKIEHMHLDQIVPRIREWLGAPQAIEEGAE
ncbi:ATP-dependent DNA helicase DinG [Paenibacillus tarimensis]|uniref:ATP-dependent DNA helicase DinG n=1 Tax=Paenibacillus tarimensis TaxID=416012 RepID=UPI001F3E16F1|nr:ATP-dependent DNA helicase DinG [Paenibacillus tarimensis]MCF2942587.1 ATP-dependent DNA helicase DinG [Paenibacillus tarimensis]